MTAAVCPVCQGTDSSHVRGCPLGGVLPYRPLLPYPDGPTERSSGWSGSDTSHERAQAEDSGGTTTARQRLVLGYLGLNRGTGATWREVADRLGWHHGQASGALSVLHKAGLVARLTERRGRCAVYVLPEWVGGREVAAQGRRQKPPPEPDAALAATVSWFDRYVEGSPTLTTRWAIIRAALGLPGRDG